MNTPLALLVSSLILAIAGCAAGEGCVNALKLPKWTELVRI